MKYLNLYEEITSKFKIGEYVKIKEIDNYLMSYGFIKDKVHKINDINTESFIVSYTLDTPSDRVYWFDEYQLIKAEPYEIDVIKYNL